MQQLLAIAGLTWKAAFRFRLFWVMCLLLIGAVVGFPVMLKDDGSAQGLTQILLTYTLSAATTLLGFFTLWFSCGTLARDVEECQMQMIAVKPISRWQVWLGKWLGILSLNAVLLAVAGAAVFTLLQVRAGHLPPDQQKILHDEIFVARASAKDRVQNIQPYVDEVMKRRKPDPSLSSSDLAEIEKQVAAQVRFEVEAVPPGLWRRWVVDLSRVADKVTDQPLQIRVKFHTAQTSPDTTYPTVWRVGPTNAPQSTMIEQSLPADSFQEIVIPAHLLDDHNKLIVDFYNGNDTPLLFPLEDGFELLYRETGFGVNFIRGLAVILCWLALLAAVGLASASFLSFPVAAFASLAVLVLGLSTSTLSSVAENNSVTGFDQSTAKFRHTIIDIVFVPVFKGVFHLVNLVESFSPIDSLSTGRSITWSQLGLAVTQIVFLMGGFFAVVGIILFTRRELASAQSDH